MRAFASTTRTSDRKPAGLFAGGRGIERHAPAHVAAAYSVLPIHRKASCACGGGCPNCEAKRSDLKVSHPNDADEVEADRVADKVMRMTEKSDRPVREIHDYSSLNRSRHSPQKGHSHSHHFPSAIREVLRSTGQPLDTSTRAFMEPRFDRDFGHVRVHTDARAAESARGVNAQAYTVGANIVFDQDRFSPHTEAGKRLLGHELAHVVQQANALQPLISRVTNTDLSIVGLAPNLARVNNKIRFHYNQATIPPEEDHKIVTQATPPGRDVTLIGYASEEGSTASKTVTVNNRISAVSNALAVSGHTGSKRPDPRPKGGEGQIDYREMRIVEIVDTPVPDSRGITPPPPTSVANCAVGASTPCGTTYTSAFPVARTAVSDAITALAAPSAATLTQVKTFFGATPAARLLTRLNWLATKMIALNKVHNDTTDCHLSDCDASCVGASAYVSLGASPEKMILCDSYRSTADVDERARTIIHESLHVTPGIMTVDVAYKHSRRVRTLTDSERLTNTDSYVNLITMLHDPAATVVIPPIDTINATTTAAERAFAQRAIDFLEQWLIKAKFISGQVYAQITAAISSPPHWAIHSWVHRTMHELSPLFGLTDPGLSTPFALPGRNDRVRVAGIQDRYASMRGVLWGTRITLTKIASGTDAWASNLGNSVEVTAPFFLMTDVNGIRHLMRLMLKSMPDVPPSLVNNYVKGADRIRTQANVGP